MSKDIPLISIAMTTYNGEKYLEKQLDSIFSQTYSNIELIVCDDKSSDRTLDILKRYQKKYKFQLFVNEQQLGVVKNFEKALEHCQGKYIALADQDDIWDEKKIKRLSMEIGSSLLIHSDARLIDEEGKAFSSSYSKTANKIFRQYTYEYFFNNDVTGCTSLFKKELLKFALPFPDDIIVHDWWLGICASKEGSIKYLNESLTSYRQHSSNQIGVADTSKVHRHKVRVEAYKKTLLYLKSLSKKKGWIRKEIHVLSNLIFYYESYFDDIFRPRSFYIHLKYFKYFLNDKSIWYRIAGLTLSLFGERMQKKLWSILNK